MFTIKSRVYASRTDPGGIMKLDGAIDILQDCSMMWMESEPSFREFLAGRRLGMFLVSRQADIIRLPGYGENITVQTRIYECRDFLGYRNTVMYGEDGQPCLLTWSIGAFVSLETGRMARLPHAEMDKVTVDPRIDMEYLDRKIALPDLPGQRLGAVAVRRKDIDMNRHMNNARYVETALEYLPEGFAVRRLRIEYKRPAKLGDQLYPMRIKDPSGKWFVLLLDSRDRPCSVMEFS